jgi:hypothetical protein
MSLLTTMIRHLCTDAAQSANRTSPDILSSPESCHVVFVATDLEIKELAWVRTKETDFERDGKVFRRLSPEYFAWLRSRMVTAQAAHKAGKLPEDASRMYCSPFPRRTTGHPRFVPNPRRNPSKFPERSGFTLNTQPDAIGSR